jgi:hypothetical protein
MMIFGMLYFDGGYKLSEVELIQVARKAFEQRTNTKATIALLYMGTDALPELDGLKVYPSYLVRPFHTIVGVPAGECNPEDWAS